MTLFTAEGLLRAYVRETHLLGARGGDDVLPARWVNGLELREAITGIADDLAAYPEWDTEAEAVWDRYAGW